MTDSRYVVVYYDPEESCFGRTVPCSFEDAMELASIYRNDGGLSVVVVNAESTLKLWRMWGSPEMTELVVMAHELDEAFLMARVIDPRYDAGMLVEGAVNEF